MSFRTMHEDYLDPDKYFGKPPDEEGKPLIHWRIRKLVRGLVGSDGAWRFYRAIYDYSYPLIVGFLVNGQWICCDSLCKFRTEGVPDQVSDWRFWHDNVVEGICVSSIVEGSDAEVPAVRLTEPDESQEAFNAWWWSTAEEVKNEADFIWHQEHDEEEEEGEC